MTQKSEINIKDVTTKEKTMAQPKYLSAIKKALEPKVPGAKKDFTPAYKTWKPEIGKKYNIRFIQAIDNGSDEPFYEILFYRNIDPNKRFVAPYQYDMPDPIKQEFDEIRRDNWNTAKLLKARESYFGILIERGKEEEGPQVFEFNKKVRDQIYAQLQSEDYEDSDIFDIENGHDFQVSVMPETDGSGKPKLWNGKQVRQYTFTLRNKPSALLPAEDARQEFMDSCPKLGEIFKNWIKDGASLKTELENFYARLEDGSLSGESASAADTSGVSIEDDEAKEAKFSAAPPSSTSDALAKLQALKAKARMA
jgi:hypothetical protein